MFPTGSLEGFIEKFQLGAKSAIFSQGAGK